MASGPKKYALLVGIDAYPSGKLNGSVNDVMGIKRILERQKDPNVEIRTLTATVGADNNIVEDETDRPTFYNFMAAMQELISKTNKGDFVYIHYSGHGTHKLQESKNEQGEDNEGRETNGFQGDLALCLLGTDPEHVDEFPCRLLANMLNDLVGTAEKKATVTLVLDCCFSARILRRSQVTIRYLPHNPSITHGDDDDDGGDSNGIITNDYYSYTGGSTYRNVDMSPSWLLNPNGYSILVACAPHESAAEVVTAQGESHGKLSYYLIKTLDKIGLTRQQREVYHHLQADFFANANTNMSASNNKGSGDDASVPPSQTPVLHGNKEQPFWGEAVTRSLGNMNESGKMPIYAVWLGSKAAVPFRLMAGEAHGFSVGDQLLLSPVKTKTTTTTTTTEEVTMDPSDQVVVAIISGTGSVTSSLHVEDIDALTATDWVAEPQSRRRLGDYPVYLDPRVTDLPQLSSLGEVLTQHSLCVHQVPTKPYDFHIKLQEKMDEEEEDALVILDPSGNKIHGIPPLLLPSIDAEDVAAPLVHLAKYSLVKSLSNPPAPKNGGDDDKPFRSTFDLYIKSRTGQRYRPGEVMELQESNSKLPSFEIYFENKGPVSLHIYIYALSPIWEVEHVHRATLDTVPAMPRANQNYYSDGFTPYVTKKLRTVVPNGLRVSGLFTHCEDVVKVLVTTHPTSFDVLEQPAYGIIEEHKLHSIPRDSEGLSLVEQWDAFNFPIRTALRAPG